MIYYKTEEEIDLIRKSSLLVAKTHAEIAGLIKPGVTTLELDKIAEEFIRDNGGVPAFKGIRRFPKYFMYVTKSIRLFMVSQMIESLKMEIFFG